MGFFFPNAVIKKLGPVRFLGFSAILVLVTFFPGVHSKQSGSCASEHGYPEVTFSVTTTEEASHKEVLIHCTSTKYNKTCSKEAF